MDVRALWRLFEPVHAVTYYAPQGRPAYEEAGLRGFWRGYFAGRAAPLGAVDAPVTTALFFSFAPAMVARALPDVWSRATPPAALAARLAGATAALRTFDCGLSAGEVEECADLLTEAVDGLDHSGRALAAATAALPVPDDPLGRVWHACTILREHRGDGHTAALVAAGLTGLQALVWRSALDLERDHLQPYRGWTDDEWSTAERQLAARGWLDAAGSATDAARTALDEVERATDRAAAEPWQRLGPERTARVAELLTALAAGPGTLLPFPNPIGLPPRDAQR